VTSQQEMN